MVRGVVGAKCSEYLVEQIVYLADNSTLERSNHAILSAVPIEYRMMLSYGTLDQIPIPVGPD